MVTGNPIILQDYDPLWPRTFEMLRSRIAVVLTGITETIEHVGSTAVPGLAAKPIIDMDVLLASTSDLPLVIVRLASEGYEHEGDLGVTGREAFRAPARDCAHHLYVCGPGSPPYLQHVAFRDYLRTHAQDADAYAALQRDLSAKFPYDRDAYTDGKSEFIAEILKRAAAHGGRR